MRACFFVDYCVMLELKHALTVPSRTSHLPLKLLDPASLTQRVQLFLVGLAVPATLPAKSGDSLQIVIFAAQEPRVRSIG